MDDSSARLVHEMAEAIASGQAVFFVGAGLSAMAGAPTWDALVNPLRESLQPPCLEQNPMLIAQFYANQFSSNELYNHLRSHFVTHPLKPTPAHAALCEMPVSVFVTTNYDDLIETQLRKLDTPTHVVRDERGLAFWTEEKEVQVLKLHGDLSSAESIVLTDWDYVGFLSDKSLMKRKLAELFCYRTVIFIGYSLRDPNVSYIFNDIAYQLGNLKRPAYIITFDADEHQHREWRRRGVRPICLAQGEQDLGPERKTTLLTELLVSLRQEVLATNRSIMIVDDDELMVSMMKDCLTDGIAGVIVHGALDGHAAMYAIGKLRPRVLIVDVMMPKLNGWELLKMIRQFPELDAMRIIVLSGDPRANDTKLSAQLRVDHFMTKPADHEALIEKTGELLGVRTRAGRESVLRTRGQDGLKRSGQTLFPPSEKAKRVRDIPRKRRAR